MLIQPTGSDFDFKWQCPSCGQLVDLSPIMSTAFDPLISGKRWESFYGTKATRKGLCKVFSNDGAWEIIHFVVQVRPGVLSHRIAKIKVGLDGE